MIRIELRHTVDTPADAAWADLLDPSTLRNRHPAIRSVAVLDSDGDVRTVAWSLALRGAPLRWEQREHIDHRSRTIRFELLAGDPQVLAGSWSVTGDTAAEIALELDFDFGLPGLDAPVEMAFERVVRELVSARIDALSPDSRPSASDPPA